MRIIAEHTPGQRRADGRDTWRYVFGKRSIWVQKIGDGKYNMHYFVNSMLIGTDRRTNGRKARKEARNWVVS